MRFSLYKTFALSLALMASISAISLQDAPPAVINPTDQPGDIHNKVEAAVGCTAKVVKIVTYQPLFIEICVFIDLTINRYFLCFNEKSLHVKQLYLLSDKIKSL